MTNFGGYTCQVCGMWVQNGALRASLIVALLQEFEELPVRRITDTTVVMERGPLDTWRGRCGEALWTNENQRFDCTQLPKDVLRNPFSFPGTQHVSTALLPLEEQWELERKKRLVEHYRDRDRWIEHGGQLGPITYTETRGDEWSDWRGEWQSAVIHAPEAAL